MCSMVYGLWCDVSVVCCVGVCGVVFLCVCVLQCGASVCVVVCGLQCVWCGVCVCMVFVCGVVCGLCCVVWCIFSVCVLWCVGCGVFCVVL